MAESANVFDQWSTARPFISAFPLWAGEENAARIASYQLYEEMYWNLPEAFKLVRRGEDTKPIYIPSGKQIVETMHRYLSPRLRIVPDPELGSAGEQKTAKLFMDAFLRRERFYGTFNAQKRLGLIRGDWAFILEGDDEREEGARVSIKAIDPASLFKITEEGDDDSVIGWHIVTQTRTNDGKDAILRTTYRKESETGGPSPITYEEAVFEMDAWGGPSMEEKRVQQTVPLTTLPAPIDQLPIYHIKNFSDGGPWGSSEMRGLERLITAISQGISDEELELVLNGLGVYVTDAGTPVNPDTGEDEPWRLGPAKVVEIGDGKTFKRVTGTTSVTPWQDHLKFLIDQLDLSAGTPAVAKGLVDVATAESGIALAIQFGPIFDRAEEKETDIDAVLLNLFWDIRNWFDAFEGFNVGEASWMPLYGDRIPENKQQKFDNVMAMFAANLVSAEWTMSELAKIGYDFGTAANMLNQIAEEKTVIAQVEADVTGSRIDAALGDPTLDGGA